jgi:hypothetical protein
MFGLDAIVALGSLILPSAIDFIKKKFLKKEQDTPEATMSALATTSPTTLPGYVTAITGWLEAQVHFFNRDVTGTPSQWVVDLRASIRPIGVVFSFFILVMMVFSALMGRKPDPAMVDTLIGVRLASEAIISSWFGDRISISKG